ncbi:loganic acid O-methyltransferase-like [Juglans microcarpa x Juglans regia]|uniref:loganic acid O-methyltransferase-like n=1 Tax=Juglans microcarpa x Juglans regia TaxID=2249226 RepID=UPI001B7DA2ED|nr:loganic acid O-methyltransferase-like [Juglans microcarpa x Juglans regia]
MGEEQQREERWRTEAYPMKGGDAMDSYANNSSYQRGGVVAAKKVIIEAVGEKLDLKSIVSSNIFRIADLGCSVGPNTFFAAENIINAVQSKCQYDQYQGGVLHDLDHVCPEFQVFFNDHSSNDFNTLFTSLPPDRQYFAAGVAGSFYCRLFPSASLHFVHSSYAINWLSKVPKPIIDKSSAAWNKGKIHYSNSKDVVVEAYEVQFGEDMECFLHARAQEVVFGGLIALVICGRPNGMPHSQNAQNITFELLGSCLMDMAKKGKVSEEKVDSFNIPMYLMSPQELEAAVDRNGYFGIERIEDLPNVLQLGGRPKSEVISSHWRAIMHGMMKVHFGRDAVIILDELLELFRKKLEEDLSLMNSISDTLYTFFALLKRQARE